MNRPARLRVGVCLLVLLTRLLHARVCWSAESSAEPVTTTERTSMVVLRDGGVLSGVVARTEKSVVIYRDGAEIQVPAAKVLIVCQSLEDAYVAQQAEINQASTADHLALATWCLSYGLKSQAKQELAAARSLEPNHPRLALLERRLAAAEPTTNSTTSPPNSAVSPREAEAKLSEAAPVKQFEEVSPAVVQRFTRKVQPILVNNCTTSGCHLRGGPQQFQLDRALLHGLANRRTTTHNLSATLALVDRAQPQLSPLLTVPRQTHGGMRAPIFGPRQAAAFNHLVDWVALVTRREPTKSEPFPTGDASTGTNLVMNLPRPVVLQNDLSRKEDASPADPANPAPMRQKASIQYGARLEPWRPKDAFDPEIFNRQKRKRAQAQVSAVAGQPQVNNRQPASQ